MAKINNSIKKFVNAKKVETNVIKYDIIICHGQDVELVKDLIDLGNSLGLNADYALNLPSGSNNQFDKVNQLILNSRIVLVLITFNREEPESQSARPNVYDELRIAITKKPKDTIILLEERDDNSRVTLPSNLNGKCIVINFNRHFIHKMYPQLLNEIRARINLNFNSDLRSKLKSGGILNKFLDEMDDIWELEFDFASEKIGNYWDTEKNFKALLDEFFIEYWNVFDALVRKKAPESEISKVCSVSLVNSYNLALRAWNLVAESQFKTLENYISDNPKHKNLNEMKKKASNFLEIIRKKREHAKIKMQDYKNVINDIKECIDKN